MTKAEKKGGHKNRSLQSMSNDNNKGEIIPRMDGTTALTSFSTATFEV